jgi:hypothetical protein
LAFDKFDMPERVIVDAKASSYSNCFWYPAISQKHITTILLRCRLRSPPKTQEDIPGMEKGGPSTYCHGSDHMYAISCLRLSLSQTSMIPHLSVPHRESPCPCLGASQLFFFLASFIPSFSSVVMKQNYNMRKTAQTPYQ